MIYHALVESSVALHQESSGRAALAVNRWLILRNWVIGHLVEFEQNGEDRAKYGARLLTELAHAVLSGAYGYRRPDPRSLRA